MSQREALVPLAVVVGAHGVRGELRVKPYNPSSELLLELRSAVLRAPGDPGRSVALRGARRHGDGLLLAVEGCTDRDAALTLRGSELCVPRAALPPPADGEYYLVDLVGLEARLPSGDPVGRVDQAIEYPASQVLNVRTARGSIEIPLHDRYVLDIRLDEGVVIVDHVDELEPVPGSEP